MAKSPRKKRSTGNIGCGYMFSIAFLICTLLIINGMLVNAFVSFNMPDVDTRIRQAMLFVLPVMMIFIEFWLYDLANRQNEE